MPKYSLIHSSLNGKSFFGIRIETNHDTVYEYRYISAFYEEADELIRKMSKDYISPVHFDDIVTDYLAQLYYDILLRNGLI